MLVEVAPSSPLRGTLSLQPEAKGIEMRRPGSGARAHGLSHLHSSPLRSLFDLLEVRRRAAKRPGHPVEAGLLLLPSQPAVPLISLVLTAEACRGQSECAHGATTPWVRRTEEPPGACRSPWITHHQIQRVPGQRRLGESLLARAADCRTRPGDEPVQQLSAACAPGDTREPPEARISNLLQPFVIRERKPRTLNKDLLWTRTGLCKGLSRCSSP